MAAADVSEPVKKKKVRKAYSVAGRPRQRGEYKCGRCGFFPKAAKHSCIEEKARMDEGRAAKKLTVPPPPPTPTSGGATKASKAAKAAVIGVKASHVTAGKKKSASRTKKIVQKKGAASPR